MKLVRLISAIVVAAIAVLVIVGEQLSGASADATINARVLPLRSPAAGRVEPAGLGLGADVEAGEVIAAVSDARADVVHLNDLIMEQELANAGLAEAKAALAATESSMEALKTRADTFRRHRIDELRARLDGARERLALLEGGRLPEGAETAEVTGDTPAPAEADPVRAPYLLSAARELVAVREAALTAAQDGVFLGDGYNDSPNAGQRLAELEPQRAMQEAAVTAAEDRLTAIDTRVSRERELTNRGLRSEILAPARGRIWQLDVAEGSVIERGDVVGALLDCGSTAVTLSVTESTYNRLKIGDPAIFKPREGDRSFDATVIRLAGAGAATVYGELAVAPSQRHLERFDVMVAVPQLAGDPDLACAIGKTGRVFFDSRPLDWLRAIFR
ncbi:HlyD family secretion protein [Frigidibacter sp. MR17.14]|uniref:HlyD family secretion protein n=1 Tax=Frigidibacter sp. MR17.14 TaxID=3126509 RepID=UPI003012E020